MKTFRPFPIVFLSLVLIFSACKSSKIIEYPEDLDLPSTFQIDGDTLSSSALLSWESFFEDQNLKDLIRFALDNNQNNLITLENIKVARAYFRQAKVGRLPEFNLFAGSSLTKFGEYTMDGVGNFDSNLSGNIPDEKRIPDPYEDFILGADFNWEVDIWGKFKNRKKAALARYIASEEMANHTKTWLISEIAQAYYLLTGLDEELIILHESIELQELAVLLSKDLKLSGRENQLAVDQFEALTLNSKALLIEKQRELRTAEINLSKLLGNYSLEHERSMLDEIYQGPKVVSLGLPASLLAYRPDVRMAEKELQATKADVQAAQADFFPSLNLGGFVGFNAFDFSRLFLMPASGIYQIGAGLTAPVFNRNRIKAAFEIANTQQRIAWYEYEQTVLTSYLEVLDILNQFDTYENQVKLKADEVEVQKRSIENSNIMFSVGYANYLEVINAQSRALLSQLELIELKTAQLQTKVKLYQALGGGWI